MRVTASEYSTAELPDAARAGITASADAASAVARTTGNVRIGRMVRRRRSMDAPSPLNRGLEAALRLCDAGSYGGTGRLSDPGTARGTGRRSTGRPVESP